MKGSSHCYYQVIIIKKRIFAEQMLIHNSLTRDYNPSKKNLAISEKFSQYKAKDYQEIITTVYHITIGMLPILIYISSKQHK